MVTQVYKSQYYYKIVLKIEWESTQKAFIGRFLIESIHTEEVGSSHQPTSTILPEALL